MVKDDRGVMETVSDLQGFHYVDGWYCPPTMNGPASYLRRAAELSRHIRRLDKRRVCVQAGGHIGIYPQILAKHFQLVYTFEPDWLNFACLAVNAAGPNIFAARAAIGEKRAGAALLLHGKNTGAHQIAKTGPGPIPMLPIDNLPLTICDAIFLDVEGYEIPALKGAMRAIARNHPLIVVEENKHGVHRGFARGDIERLLEPMNYKVIDRVGEDLVVW